MDRHIVPVEPASGHGDTVLIQVQQENPSSAQLDLRLVGCEGESPYVATIKHRQLDRLQHKFKGTSAEWESILSHFLLPHQFDHDHERNRDHDALLQGVRMVYVLNNATLKLSIRQDVQGIKVTLGEIDMPIDEDLELNPFEWAQTSARAHARALQELLLLKARVQSEQQTTAKLHAQLDEFICTKNDTETAMLEQFMELLNLKKLKIRDQSRLLAVAEVDESTASAVQASRTDSKTRTPGTSRASKRKAPAKAMGRTDSDAMELDSPKVEQESDEEMVHGRAATPDRESDDETESEDESGNNGRQHMSSETARPFPAIAQTTEEETAASNGPPPVRSLPFSRRATRNSVPKKQPSPPTDDDETEDEEL